MTPKPPMDTVYRTDLSRLRRLREGKVRDLYEIDDEHLLLVATDRLSAFDVVLPTPIPGKGETLTRVSEFWFGFLADALPNHRSALTLDDLPLDAAERAQLEGRSVCVRRLEPLPVEAIVRGYLIGSGWRDYREAGAVCGIALPAGLRLADRLPEPLFTPSTKARDGAHDENIPFAEVENRLGRELAARVRGASLELYARVSAHAAGCGVIVADTKFEFGLGADGALTLIDEALTPDSSRFWDAADWRPGDHPHSFDKQFVRDWLTARDWDRRPPGPELPPEIVSQTAARYQQIGRRLCGPAPDQRRRP